MVFTCGLGSTCNPNNLQFYGLYLVIKGYLLLNCRLLEPQVGFQGLGLRENNDMKATLGDKYILYTCMDPLGIFLLRKGTRRCSRCRSTAATPASQTPQSLESINPKP